MKRIASVLVGCWIAGSALAQNPILKTRDYPIGYFRNPLDIAPQASGTFGELRSTHFHAGDDYRTQQRTGLPLYAVAEGFVSRVRVQNGGGGLSVYLEHPNGFTSVYLHMLSFMPELEKRIKEEQYRLKRNDVDLTLQPTNVPVSKGQRIGLAGNTGSSQGPHLHFEIRDTKTQHPINPQLFGLKFPDKTRPTIQGITIFDLDDAPFSEHTPRRHQPVKMKESGHYVLSQDKIIPVNGPFGVGIQTIDRHDGTTFNNGVYSIQLQLNNKDISTVLFETLDFGTSSAIHSYIDYPSFILKNIKIQKSFKDSNHPTGVYHQLQNRGIIHLTNNEVHTLTYIVKDIHGNTSQMSFKVQKTDSYIPIKPTIAGVTWFEYDKDNDFETDQILVNVPEDALYERVYFTYSQGAKPAQGYSTVHHVHNRMTPLFKAYQLAIRPDESLPSSLYDKAIIVNHRGASIGGHYDKGYVRTETKQFGSFHIRIDTLSPKIQSLQLKNGMNVAALKRISFRITDDLSGIHSFNAYIDDQWVLMEYDPKTAIVWHVFEPDLAKGAHSFRLEVTDGKKNQQVFRTTFSK